MELLVNQIAQQLLQLLGALVLATASILLLKARTYLDGKVTEQQMESLKQRAITAVHFAEKEGVGKLGAEKAIIAQQYVNGELAAAGITSVKAADIEATVVGAVEQAWAEQIGETYHKPPEPASDPTPTVPIGTPPGTSGTLPPVYS